MGNFRKRKEISSHPQEQIHRSLFVEMAGRTLIEESCMGCWRRPWKMRGPEARNPGRGWGDFRRKFEFCVSLEEMYCHLRPLFLKQTKFLSKKIGGACWGLPPPPFGSTWSHCIKLTYTLARESWQHTHSFLRNVYYCGGEVFQNGHQYGYIL